MEHQINIVKNIIKNIETSLEKLKIYMVVNVKDTTNVNSDYNNYSVTTEFFSGEELNEIILAFRECGVYTEIFFGENKFINMVLNSNNFKCKDILVYNAAQNGTGPGRKSLIPAFCNLHNIPITGSNAYVVSLCRNKYHVNKLLEAHNIPVARSWLYDNIQNGWLMNKTPEEGLCVIAKPIYESASIGIEENSRFKFSSNKIELLKELSFELKQPIIVQEFVDGYEAETPVFNYGKDHYSFFPVGISWEGNEYLDNKFLTYENIYFDNYNFYNFNSIDIDTANLMIHNSKIAARSIGMSGLGRVDYRIDKNKKIFITDVSTNPHLTSHSSYYYMFKDVGLQHHDIFKLLIGSAFSKEIIYE